MKFQKLIFGAILAIALYCPTAFADSILFTGTSTFTEGTGFGNVLNVLTLQVSSGSEYGSITPPDVESGDAMPSSTIRTIQELLDVGASATSFSVIFNVNQQGVNDAVTIQNFSIDFYTSAGASLGSVTWTGSELLDVAGQGTGSSGYLFDVTLTTLAGVFSDPTNLVGMSVPSGSPILNANDGPENFYLGPGEGQLVPEPSTLLLMGAGLLGAARLSRSRRKNR